jgi:hypothetical protein
MILKGKKLNKAALLNKVSASNEQIFNAQTGREIISSNCDVLHKIRIPGNFLNS